MLMQSASPFLGEDLGGLVRPSHDLDPLLDTDASRAFTIFQIEC